MMYSFGGEKKGALKKNTNPGPGTYESTEKTGIYRTSPKCKIGTADRLAGKKYDGPGPGAYDSYSKEGIQYSFGAKTGKISNNNKHQTPGPGTYEGTYTVKASAPSYTLGGKKYKKNYDDNLPGPGAYEYKSTVTGVPAAKLGTSKRNDGFSTKATPGPGAYGESQRPFSANTMGCKFGTSNRMNDAKTHKYGSNNQPGPGEYEHQSTFNTTKGVSMGTRKGELYDKEKAKVPGPGAYDGNKMIPTKQVRIGTSARDTIKDNQVPGPGSYERGFIDKKSTPGCRMGTSSRRPLSAAQETPGPGNYNYQEKIAEGPKYHFGAKPREEESKANQQQFMPGPGQYLPDYNMTQSKQATFAFGKDPKDRQPKQDLPGPGQYDTTKKIGGPSFGFGSGPREQKLKNDAPGPGAYEQGSAIGKVPKYLLPNGPKVK